MAANVGGVSCWSVVGPSCDELTQTAAMWSVPGVDGVGEQLLGRRATPMRVVARFLGTAAAAATWETNVRALIQTLISAEDDWGRTTTRLRVRGAAPMTLEARARPGTVYECVGTIVLDVARV